MSRRPQQRARAWIVLALVSAWAFALPYALLVLLDSRVVERYLLPLYPLFALLGAGALSALHSRLRRDAPMVVCTVALLAFPAWTSARFTWIGRQPSTYDQLARWLEAQPDATRSRVLLSLWITPPLCPTAEALAQQLATSSGRSQPWFRYLGGLSSLPENVSRYDLRTLPPELYQRSPPTGEDEVLAALEALHPSWIVLEDTPRVLTFPAAKAIHAAVRAHAERVEASAATRARTADRSIARERAISRCARSTRRRRARASRSTAGRGAEPARAPSRASLARRFAVVPGPSGDFDFDPD